MSIFRKNSHKAEASVDRLKLKVKEALNLFDPVILYPYRGYGTGTRFFIDGRVLEKEHMIHDADEESNSLWNNLRKIWKRYESDEVPGVEIEAEMDGIRAHAVSDDEGFFKLVFEVPQGKRIENGWHEATLHITGMPFDLEYEKTATASVNICNQENCYGIISDVDDTIIKSSAMNPLKKMQIMLTKNARHRVAFDRVDQLYTKLISGDKNPLFFVSGSSWNLYDMLVEFCRDENIPSAPFFLRNLGLSADQWLRKDTSMYKKEHIRHIMQVFDKLSFLLIGDSGQQDPEIYTGIYREFPDQVKGIYIRQVHNDERKQQLKEIAGTMDVPFVLFEGSEDALRHAIEMKWVQ